MLVSDWQNPLIAEDVNGDGGDTAVSPLDAILVINELFEHRISSVNGVLPDISNGTPAPPPFVDVTGDGVVSPLDAILVINKLSSVTTIGGKSDTDTIPSGNFVSTALAASFPAARLLATSEFLVNATTERVQKTPVVAVHNSGFVIAWSSLRQDGSSWGIYAQRFDVAGHRVGSEFLVSRETLHSQNEPAITTMDDGRFAVAWTSAKQDGSSRGVFARLFDTFATPLSDDIRLNQTILGPQRAPAITYLDDGTLVASWEGRGGVSDSERDHLGVFARRFAVDGSPIGDERRINPVSNGVQDSPDIAATPDGGFVVAWDGHGSDDGSGVFLRKVTENFEFSGPAIRVNSSAGGIQSKPAVDVHQDGRIVVAWNTTGDDASGWGVFAQQFNSSLQRLGPEVKAPAETHGTQWHPDVAYLGDDGFVVGWDGRGKYDNNGVHMRRFTSDSIHFDDEERVSNSTSVVRNNVRFDASRHGFVATWNGWGPPDSAGAYARIFEAGPNNLPPVFPAPTNVTIDELSTWTSTVTASDPDGDALMYTLDQASQGLGLQINANTGRLDWTPTEQQGPGVYMVTVTATDPAGSIASQSFSVSVREVNSAPTLAAINELNINELAEVILLPMAADSDNPSNALTLSLVNSPAGATINATSGEIRWTPNEAQGPGRHAFEVRVTDNGSPLLSASQMFFVTVAEVDLPPVLNILDNVVVNELSLVTFTATATDSDLPSEILTYSLGAGAPDGASIDPVTGVFRWVPTEAQGPGQVTVDIIARDTGSSALSHTRPVTITVVEVPSAPVLAPIDDVEVVEANEISLFAVATDSDLPLGRLRYSLTTGPQGATIDATTGNIRWTPGVMEQGQPQRFVVSVEDDTVPPLTDQEEFFVRVGCEFPQGLLGWQIQEFGGDSIPGTIVTGACDVALTEGDSFVVELSRSFLVEPSQAFRITYESLSFDTSSNREFINDAFEIAVIDVDGHPVVDTFIAGRDAVFNVTESFEQQTAQGVDVDGNTITVSLDGIPTGTMARLVLRLVNNDADEGTTVRITDVDVITRNPVARAVQPIGNASARQHEGGLPDLNERQSELEALGQSAVTIAVSGPTVSPAGQLVLTSGQVLNASNLVGVFANGVPVDVVDSAGRFFALIDVRPGVNTVTYTGLYSSGSEVSTTLDIFGTTQANEFDTSRFSDITGSFSGVYGRTSFKEQSNVLFVNLATRNDGTFVANAPLLVGIKNITDPTVHVLDADGVLPDGTPYVDLSSFINNSESRLPPGGLTASPAFAFHNPNRIRFDYELVFYGKLNEPPAFTTVPNIEGLIDKPYLYDSSAVDADGDHVTYRLVERPDPGMTIASDTGLIQWTPTLDYTGSHTVVIEASDNRGGVALQRYSLSVIAAPPNRPPVITSTPVTTAVAYRFNESNVVEYESEWRYQVVDPGEIPGFEQPTFDDAAFSVGRGGFGSGGGCLLNMTARNTLWRTNSDILLRREIELPVGATSLTVKGAIDNDIQVFLNGIDISQGVQTTEGCAERNEFSMVAPDSAIRPGKNIIAIRAKDRGAESYVDAIIQVRLPDLLTVIPAGGDFNYRYDVKAIDPDADTLVFRPLQIPFGMRITPDGGQITWIPTPEQVGNHPVRIEVSDGRGGIATQEFVVCVKSDPANHAPIIVSDPIPNATIGTIYRYQVDALDPDDDTIVYSIATSDAVGLTIEPSTGLITWNTAGQEAGTRHVTVRAVDGRGGSDEQRISINLRTPGLGIIRGAKFDDQNANGVRDPLSTNNDGSPANEDAILVLTWNGLGNSVEPAIESAGFEVISAQLAPGTLSSVLATRDDINQVWIWLDGSAGLGSFTPADPDREFNSDDLAALAAFQVEHPHFIMDGLSFRGHNNVAEIGLTKNEVFHLNSVGGGIVLGTDDGGPGSRLKQHVNQVATAFGFNLFEGIYYAANSAFREGGTLLSAPDTVSFTNISSTGSYSNLPHGPQPNGRFLVTSIFASPATPFSSAYPVLSSAVFNNNSYDSVNYLVTTTIPGAGIDPISEPGIGNWIVYLDTNDNGRPDPHEQSTLTNASGEYEFTGLPPGTYIVREEERPGWRQTFPSSIVEGTNLLTNGSFELPEPAVEVDGLAMGSTYLTGWSVTADTVDAVTVYWLASDGVRSIDLDGTPGFGAIAQTFATTPGVSYQVAFDLGANSYRGPVVKRMRVSAAGQFKDYTVDTTGRTTPQDAGWQRETWTFTAESESTTLEFRSLNTTGGTDGAAIDNVVVLPTIQNPGSYTVMLGDGEVILGRDFGNVQINTANNTNPAFVSVGLELSTFGELYRYDALARDADNDQLTYALISGPDGMTINPETGTVVWYPREPHIGDHQVVLRAIDGQGGIALQEFVISVQAPNTAPVFTSSPGRSAIVGRTFVYNIAVQDADGDELTVTLENDSVGTLVSTTNMGPNNEQLQASYRLEWTPTTNELAAGSGTIKLVVSDGHGGVARQTMDVIVVAISTNVAPQIHSQPRLIARPNLKYGYAVLATDANDDALTYSIDATAHPPVGMTISPDGIIAWTPPSGASGVHPVKVLVSDGVETATQEFSITIASEMDNRRPLIVSNPPTTAREDKSYHYDARATDDDGDPLLWTLEKGPLGMSLSRDQGTIRWIPRTDQVGMHEVVLRATDVLGASTVQSYTIDVSCTNLPPLILSAPPTQAAVGELYFYGVRAQDPDGDPLTFHVDSGPATMTILNGLIRWTPTVSDVGVLNPVVIRVVDEDGAVAIQQFQLQVTAATNANRGPQITSVPVFSATVDEPYRYQLEATDPDGDALTFRLLLKPDWLTINEATGLISGTPTGAATISDVVVEVTDGTAKTTQGFALGVRVNQVPVIRSLPLTDSIVGGVYRYSLNADDPDDDPLTYALVNGPTGMTMDGVGRVLWNVPVDFNSGVAPGTTKMVPVAITVTDSHGAVAPQNYSINVSHDASSPTVQLEIRSGNVQLAGENNLIDQGSRTTIRVLAVDNVAIARRSLEVNGQMVALNDRGEYSFTANETGEIELVATAYDLAGNPGTARRLLEVVAAASRSNNLPTIGDPNLPPHPAPVTGDTSEPLVMITSPEISASVTDVTPIIGTIDDPENNLWYWRVYTGRLDRIDIDNLDVSDPDLTVLATGTNEIHNSEIAKFDPSPLTNDPYAILVAAYDATGKGYIAATIVTVEGNIKLGEFRLEFTDLSLPVAGIPIEVRRVYDSREAVREGDFGFGWSLGTQDPRILEVGAVGEGGTFVPDRTKVYLNSPGGQRVGFTYKEQFVSGFPGFGSVFRPSFVADPGVYDTLTVDDTEVGRGGIIGALGGEGINPEFYTLTTVDGTKYRYHQSRGLESITDTNSNVLTFSRDGIRHSSGTSVEYVRDGRGRITDILSPDGRRLRYEYDAMGDLRSFSEPITDNSRLTTQFAYHPRARHYLQDVIDPRGVRASRTEYDDEGRVSKIIDASGMEVLFDRTLRDENLERVQDTRGVWTALKYDDFGNVKEERTGEHRNASGQTVYDSIKRYDYIHERDGVTSPNRDKEWKVTQVFLDAQGNETKTVTTEYDYDSAGNVTKVVDVIDGERLERGFSYNRFNRVSTVRDELGRVTVFDYDEKGNLNEIVNATGDKSAITYDNQGRPTSYTDFRGFTTRFEYEGSQSQPSRIFNPDHTEAIPSVRRFEYNARGQVTQSTDEEGIVTEYRYDGVGQKTYERIGTDAAVRYEYESNLLKRKVILRSEVEPGKTDIVTEYGYTATGLLQFETDSLGSVTGYEYDGAGNRTFLGRWNSKAEYDADLAAKVTNPATVFPGRYPKATFEHVFVYDRLGRVDYELDDVQLNLAEEAGISLEQITVRLDHDYDSAGNRVRTIDRNSRVRSFQYDERNRLVGEEWFTNVADNSPDRSFVWEYTTIGNLERATEYDGPKSPSDPTKILSRYTYSYDVLNRVTAVNNAGTKDMPQIVLSYGYDENGNRTSVTDSLGVAVKSTYDNRNRLDTRWWENETGALPQNAVDEVLVDFDYYRNGREKELGRFTGRAAVEANRVGRTLYANPDASGRIQKISHQNSTGSILAEYNYLFDKMGLVDSLSYDNATSVNDGVQDPYDFFVDYLYDDLGQLTDADYSDVTTNRGIYVDEFYRYDKNGNRTDSHLHRKATQSDGTSYVTDTGNRLMSDGTFDYRYDDEGNMIRKIELVDGHPTGEVTVFEYDFRNRMVKATRWTKNPALGSGAVILSESTNRYDMDGRRIAFTADEDGAGANPAVETRVIHNGDDAWADFATAKQIVVHYILGNRQDHILARYESDEGALLYMSDSLGSVRDVYESTNQLMGHVDYSSFGADLSRETDPYTDRFRFQGRELDDATKLYHFRARQFDPSFARYFTQDPLGFSAGDPNVYRFVNNSPLNFADPTGLLSIPGYSLLNTIAVLTAPGITAVTIGVVNHLSIVLAKWSSADLPGQQNGPGDAVRHCVWMATLAGSLGPRVARSLGDLNEFIGANPIDARRMDLVNNEVGISIGTNEASGWIQHCRNAVPPSTSKYHLTVLPPASWSRP